MPADLKTETTYSQWHYVSAFNFNRLAAKRWAYPGIEVRGRREAPSGREVYFLNRFENPDFAKSEGLTVVYINGESEEMLAAGCSAWLAEQTQP